MHSLHYLMMKTYLRLNRQVILQSAQLGLSPGQPKVLEYLAEFGEREQRAIAEHCEIEQATVGSILSRMEQAGLIERRQRPGNRRSLYVSLTAAGAEKAALLAPIFQEAEVRLMEALSEEEIRQLAALLEKAAFGPPAER